MNLAEKMKKFVTVKKTKCPKCRNAWFFLHPSLHECTTCGAGYKRETITHDDTTIALGALMLMEEMSGSSPIVVPDSSLDTSPELQSPSAEPWSGGGGDFNGAGASGSFDDTPSSDSGSFDSGSSDSGSSFDSGGGSSFGD